MGADSGTLDNLHLPCFRHCSLLSDVSAEGFLCVLLDFFDQILLHHEMVAVCEEEVTWLSPSDLC